MQKAAQPDHYQILQISPAAEPSTVECVYRFLAMRSSAKATSAQDPAKIQLVKNAYEILRDPAKRAAYDAERASAIESLKALAEAVPPSSPGSPPRPPSHPAVPGGRIDVAAAKAEERRKRQLVLDTLYERMLTNPGKPGINLIEMERIIQVPKEDLNFAMWYLLESRWVKSQDNGLYAITFLGVNAAEGIEIPTPELPSPAPDTEAGTASNKSL